MDEHRKETSSEFIIECVILTLYAALFTAVTIGLGLGGALAAVYKGLFRNLRDTPTESSRGEQFKEDFLSTMPHSLLATLLIALLAYLAHTILTAPDAGLPMMLLGGFVALETILLAAYVFPALGVFKFQNTLHAFKTALLMSHFHVLTTLKVIASFVIAFLGAIEVSLFLLPFSLVLYAFLSSKALHPTFLKYVERIEADQNQKTHETQEHDSDKKKDDDEDPFKP